MIHSWRMKREVLTVHIGLYSLHARLGTKPLMCFQDRIGGDMKDEAM